MKKPKEQKLIELLEAEAIAHGFELVDVEFLASGHSGTIRVYLDKSGGLSIDDIVEANKWVNFVVEANEPFAGSYTLEVSSPGIDRPLRTLQHFIDQVGQEVKIVTAKLNGRSNWSGKIQAVEGEEVVLEIDGEAHRILHSSIKKAHLKGKIEL